MKKLKIMARIQGIHGATIEWPDHVAFDDVVRNVYIDGDKQVVTFLAHDSFIKGPLMMDEWTIRPSGLEVPTPRIHTWPPKPSHQ